MFKLRVKGSIGVREGLGVDELTLDLSEINGLAVLVGKNGSSKSTVLELLQPYARMVSRTGALASHFFGRDAYKELWFPFQGHQYHSLIKIDSENGRTEGYLWKDEEEKSMTDGKISVYNRVLVNLLGSPDLFFASTFCAQNAQKLNELTTAKLKELFSEILRLDKLIDFEEVSKKCKNLIVGMCDKLDIEIDALCEVSEDYDEDIKTKSDAILFKQELESELLKTQETLGAAETKLQHAQGRIEKNGLVEIEIKNLKGNIDSLSLDIHKDKKQAESEVDSFRRQYRKFDSDILESESLLSNEDEIKKAAKQVEKISAQILIARNLLDSLTKKHQEAHRFVIEQDKANAQIRSAHKELINEGKTGLTLIEHKLTTADLSISDLEKRDPACTSKICSFIVRGLQAQKDKPELIARRKDHRKAIEEEQAKYFAIEEDLSASTEALIAAEVAVNDKKDQAVNDLAKLDDQVAALRPLASEISKVTKAIAIKESAEKQKARAFEEGTLSKLRWKDRIAAKTGQLEETQKAFDQLAPTLDDQANNDMLTAVGEINSLKGMIKIADKKLFDTLTSLSLIEERLGRKAKAMDTLSEKQERKSMLLKEKSEWIYLKDACSKDGLRALEIDAMSPAIAGHANNLLIDTFGPSFTIRFKTLDDEGRETLEIIIIKENGAEVPLRLFSGGEKVWILQALRLSVTLINQEKSTTSFPIGFADELDGALDAENAVDFIQMYRAFMESGGFDNFFFISHKTECQSLADHVVRFGDGRIVID